MSKLHSLNHPDILPVLTTWLYMNIIRWTKSSGRMASLGWPWLGIAEKTSTDKLLQIQKVIDPELQRIINAPLYITEQKRSQAWQEMVDSK